MTEADEAAERLILAGLARLDPAIPVIAEEAAAAGRIPPVNGRFYLVDPLDGTKEFISRNGEFTVNIALIENGAPGLGVVLCPGPCPHLLGRDRMWAPPAARSAATAISPGRICMSAPAPPMAQPSSPAARTATTPPTAFSRQIKVKSLVSAGSSLKFCLVAAGEADLYPRFGRTMEWDTAAGHAVLAGGRRQGGDRGRPAPHLWQAGARF